MGRLHCPTCMCGDEPVARDRAFRVDTRAPFYGLVIELDRLSLDEQRDAFHRTLTKGTAHDDLPDAPRLRAGQ